MALMSGSGLPRPLPFAEASPGVPDAAIAKQVATIARAPATVLMMRRLKTARLTQEATYVSCFSRERKIQITEIVSI
jgi:hypothetical protein